MKNTMGVYIDGITAEQLKNADMTNVDIINYVGLLREVKGLITWLIEEVWNEELWELNYQAFPELLCRRLVEMGCLKEENGEYEKVDFKEFSSKWEIFEFGDGGFAWK